jgi:DNA polymerase-3 subunit epsilon/ATP-dependent DNA helicase DinG
VHAFVALDLELTPSVGDQQRIIEVAAVRFRDGAVVDVFSTLVNPGCALDARVGALTGIRQTQLNAAPSLEAVISGLIHFVGNEPIVGQSINFDLEALDRSGVRLANESYDTFELASILLPGLPAYDLGTIARTLEVELEREHRAEGDALVAGRGR